MTQCLINGLIIKTFGFLGLTKISNETQSVTNEANYLRHNLNLKHCINGIETKVISSAIYDRPNVVALRTNTTREAAEARQRRIIKMLFVVVLEFFICWTPI